MAPNVAKMLCPKKGCGRYSRGVFYRGPYHGGYFTRIPYLWCPLHHLVKTKVKRAST
jgi:hypothetical protein